MKEDKNILIAFLLNLFFSIFEFVGGILTNSVSIISDSVHDFADALSIGISYILEKISTKKPNKIYTYGYVRFSVLGALVTTTILLVGSAFMIYNSIKRFINPVQVNYSGMILFALIGVIVNLVATVITSHGNSLNQKSVNLHMLEDVFGWLIVLIGAIIMKFTNIMILDPIMSIIVSLFILINAIKNFKSIISIFMEKVPNNISIDNIKQNILKIDGIIDVHHIHIWSMDGYNNYATMHIVINNNVKNVKQMVREELKKQNISHVTLEIESEDGKCDEAHCTIYKQKKHNHNHDV